MQVDDNTLLYNGLDSLATLHCANKFMLELDQNGYRAPYEHTIQLFAPLMYMQGRGIKVDNERLKQTSIEISKKMSELQEQINRTCGRFLNPNSSKDCQKYFYVEKGIAPYTKRNGKTGNSSVTCDDKALARIARGTSARRGLPEARLIQQYRGYNKLKGTYLDIRFDTDGRIRCSYNPRGTRFGRLSSSETIFETGTNMQNLPEEFKTFLVADEGCIFLELDKRQAEWVVVAYDAMDASMIKAVEEGKDVHSYTASKMFKVPEEIILLDDEKIGKHNEPYLIEQIRKDTPELASFLGQWMPRTMSMRQCGKKSNHGLNYDEGADMFGLINEITKKESEVVIEFYHTTYPGIKKWYERTQKSLGLGRTLTNCFGRKCRFLDKWGDKLFKAAYSYNPQSTVGELVNRGIVAEYDDKYEGLEDFEILAQTHDSVLNQSPLGNLEKTARGLLRIKDHLTPTLHLHGRDFRIETDLKIGFDWGTMIKVKLVDDPVQLAANLRKAVDDLKKTK